MLLKVLQYGEAYQWAASRSATIDAGGYLFGHFGEPPGCVHLHRLGNRSRRVLGGYGRLGGTQNQWFCRLSLWLCYLDRAGGRS